MYKFKFILLFVTRFETLSKRDKSTPINMKSLQYLAAKLFKVRNGLSPEIMKEIFAFQENEAYSLRSGVCVCVCVCVFVFVCVYALPPVGFFRQHNVCDFREKFGSTIFRCEYF